MCYVSVRGQTLYKAMGTQWWMRQRPASTELTFLWWKTGYRIYIVINNCQISVGALKINDARWKRALLQTEWPGEASVRWSHFSRCWVKWESATTESGGSVSWVEEAARGKVSGSNPDVSRGQQGGWTGNGRVEGAGFRGPMGAWWCRVMERRLDPTLSERTSHWRFLSRGMMWAD